MVNISLTNLVDFYAMVDVEQKYKFSFKEYENGKLISDVKVKPQVKNYTWMELTDEFQKFLILCGFDYLADIDFSKVLQKALQKTEPKRVKK